MSYAEFCEKLEKYFNKADYRYNFWYGEYLISSMTFEEFLNMLLSRYDICD
jgi:hypothetical protein